MADEHTESVNSENADEQSEPNTNISSEEIDTDSAIDASTKESSVTDMPINEETTEHVTDEANNASDADISSDETDDSPINEGIDAPDEQSEGSVDEPIQESVSSPAWLAADAKDTPMWLRTLYASLPVSAVCVLHGQVHDLHPVQVGDALYPDTTINAIWKVLEQSGFDALLVFDPINGLSIRSLSVNTTEKAVRKYFDERIGRGVFSSLLSSPGERASQRQAAPNSTSPFSGVDALAEAIAQSEEPACALVIDYTSQVRDENSFDDETLRQLMLTSLLLADSHALYNDKPVRFDHPCRQGRLRHPIIWLLDNIDDLPVWLTSGDGIRQIPVAKPDVDMRRRAAELLVKQEVSEEELESVSQRFADATEGFTMRGMFESVQLAHSGDSVASNIEGAVRTYREGLSENPWQSVRLRELLADGEEILRRRVLGQDAAVEKVLDILKRSVLGLTGAHQKKQPTMPRGVLYFAGPTGVGKTEMVKAMTELVFADERALLRFDMSEFADAQAKIRLVGAPPSYIGYGSGGELTNAVQQRPHCIILFDEMDKAGAEINDLFLQILSDGRLTDGSGRVTSFSEALIVFTSNQGVAALGEDLINIDMNDPVQVGNYEGKIRGAVERHFKQTLGRPELLGRIGDNVVVFHPIHGEIARNIADNFIDTILSNVRIRIGNTVTMTDFARDQLIESVTSAEDLAKGARGITTALEDRLTNPLGRVLFDEPRDALLQITGFGIDINGQPDIEIEQV